VAVQIQKDPQSSPSPCQTAFKFTELTATRYLTVEDERALQRPLPADSGGCYLRQAQRAAEGLGGAASGDIRSKSTFFWLKVFLGVTEFWTLSTEKQGRSVYKIFFINSYKPL
jgi:hypothetical protein